MSKKVPWWVLKGINGRDGWLALWLWSMIVGPFFSLGQTHNELKELRNYFHIWPAFAKFESHLYATLLVKGVFYWLAAYILVKSSDRLAPFRALIAYWAGGFAYLAALAWVFSKHLPMAGGGVVALGGVQVVLWGVVWTLYVLFSSRVRNTYCEDLIVRGDSESVRTQNLVETPASQTTAVRATPAKQEDAEPVQADEEALVHELRMFKLPSSGQWYWAAKNRRGQLLARGGPLKTWMECAKQFHASGYR